MFYSSNFESDKSLGKRVHILSYLGFEIQKNFDSETLELKLHSFRGFQPYLTDKNPTRGRGTVSVFQFIARRF